MTNAMSAGLLRRVVATVQRYRAVLGPDEFVEPGGRGFAVYGDDVLGRPGPGDIKGVESVCEQTKDVFGPIGEVIADTAHAAVIGDDTAAVAMDQTDDEL